MQGAFVQTMGSALNYVIMIIRFPSKKFTKSVFHTITRERGKKEIKGPTTIEIQIIIILAIKKNVN